MAGLPPRAYPSGSPESEIQAVYLAFLLSCAHLRPAARPPAAPSVVLLDGYRIEAVATGLTSPRAVTFDNVDGIYVLEATGAGSRIVRLGPAGGVPVATTEAAWTGATWHEGGFLVTEAGGGIVRIGPDGEQEALALNPRADPPHECGGLTTDTPVVGPDGWVYFGQRTLDPRATPPDTTCTLGLFRTPPSGGRVERVASGFPNPFDVVFSSSGCLFVADTGGGGQLWEILPGEWYGRPDERLRLLAHPPPTPPEPAVRFDTRPDGIDFSRARAFGHLDMAFVATVDASGPRILRVDPEAGTLQPFAANRGEMHGPGRAFGAPVALRFDPAGRSLYVVDAGAPVEGAPLPGAGVLWRIWRED